MKITRKSFRATALASTLFVTPLCAEESEQNPSLPRQQMPVFQLDNFQVTPAWLICKNGGTAGASAVGMAAMLTAGDDKKTTFAVTYFMNPKTDHAEVMLDASPGMTALYKSDKRFNDVAQPYTYLETRPEIEAYLNKNDDVAKDYFKTGTDIWSTADALCRAQPAQSQPAAPQRQNQTTDLSHAI